jgi:enterochelin esterase-like enzyme
MLQTMLSRRRMLVASAAGVASAALPWRARADAPKNGAPETCEVRDIAVEGDRALGRRFTLLVPKHLAPGEKVPLLVLLHGLGETGDERMGAFAWIERYGLGTAYDRLRRAPLSRTSKRPDWSDARLAEANAQLAAQPFRGLAIACPYTPNVNKQPNPAAATDGYARWLLDVVVPRARQEAPVVADAAHTALDGCSMGGPLGLEVFLRRPEAFAAWGSVQSAFGAHRAAGYADRLAKALSASGPRALHLLTSSGDPFREANEALSRALTARKVTHDARVLPGPHDQPWLREAGTIEMLLWHDRRPR